MFTVPQPNTKFMESLIFTLYNFGSNQREEFLLIKLFRWVTSSLVSDTALFNGLPEPGKSGRSSSIDQAVSVIKDCVPCPCILNNSRGQGNYKPRRHLLFWIYFRTALQREIATKVVKLDDVVRNKPLVLKLVVTYNR